MAQWKRALSFIGFRRWWYRDVICNEHQQVWFYEFSQHKHNTFYQSQFKLLTMHWHKCSILVKRVKTVDYWTQSPTLIFMVVITERCVAKFKLTFFPKVLFFKLTQFSKRLPMKLPPTCCYLTRRNKPRPRSWSPDLSLSFSVLSCSRTGLTFW